MTKERATGYDRYINWKLFIIPVVLLFVMVFMPTPKSMLDVGVEYSYGTQYVEEFFAQKLFSKSTDDLEQWQMQMVRMMEVSMQKSAFGLPNFLKRNEKWCSKNDVPATAQHLAQVKAFAQTISPEDFRSLMKEGYDLRVTKLTYDKLKDSEKKKARVAGKQVAVAVGIILFVVVCFLTESIPLPMVAFAVGIIALTAGIVDRETVAGMYWSDATWFIMGSLMFSTAFVKTGVDRRLAMMMFGRLKNANIKWITLIMIAVIAPLTMFVSDHALAAMFLPLGVILYTTASAGAGREDPELAKMLMITIAMAANLGGSLIPSGSARNIIMMGYAEDMFGVSIPFGRWAMYCVPWLLIVAPITWLVINWRFKPEIRELGEAMSVVKAEIARTGKGWSRQQKLAVVIFVLMFIGWVTESNLILKLTGIRFGVGVFAVIGAVAYILTGVVNWRDYQTRVDWGVVWLYAGAIIFGRVLVKTGGAYWLARTILEVTVPLGLGKGLGLLLSGNVIIGLMTQLMADGPACAAVGPVTMAMAGIAHPASTMIPFMAMSTAMAASLAYCLVIGTPPNAIVYASGYLVPKDFLRAGLILWFTNMGALLLFNLVFWPLLGWPGLTAY